MSDHIIGQEKKIDLIHNLFNIYKNNNDKFKYNDNKIIDIIFNSNKMSIFDEKISEVRSSSNILEKSYQELYSLNKNLNNKVDKLEKKLEIQEEQILYLTERLTLNEEHCVNNTKQIVEKEHHTQESNNEWTKVIKSGNKKISHP